MAQDASVRGNDSGLHPGLVSIPYSAPWSLAETMLLASSTEFETSAQLASGGASANAWLHAELT